MDLAVLTGDHAASGRRLEQQVGQPVHAGLLPEAKVQAVYAIQQAGRCVAMVGDGINDAPALAASDLGIALGCGTNISRENASVCLLSDDLDRLPWAIQLARQSVSIIRQNLSWAFGYNSVGIALAAAGWLNPAVAAGLMVASSLFVIGNTLRLTGDDEIDQTVEPIQLVTAEPARKTATPDSIKYEVTSTTTNGGIHDMNGPTFEEEAVASAERDRG